MALRIIRLSLFLLAATFIHWPAHAQSTNNGAQVNAETGQQDTQVVVSDGAGGAIIVWQDARSGVYDIYAQRLDAAGNSLWNASGASVCVSSGEQSGLRAISDGVGGVIMTWQDSRTGTYDIYAQRLNSSGQALWTLNGTLLCQANNIQSTPDLVTDGSGGAIVTWQDFRTNEYDIYAQRVAASGAMQWTVNGVNLTLNGSYQQFPGIVRDGAGGCIIAWQDSRNGSSDLYAQKLNASGVAQWQFNGIEVSAAPGEQRAHRMVEDGFGGVLVAWEDLRNGPVHIYGQRLNAGGVALWTVNGAAILTASSGASSPRIASDGAAGCIVAWQDLRSGGSQSSDIYAQRVPAGGIPAWTGNGNPVCTVSGEQSGLQIASVGSGSIVLTWHDNRLGSNYDIYAQRLDVAGVPGWSSDGLQISGQASQQAYPAIAGDGAGGAFIVWQDLRYSSSGDLFAQRVSATQGFLFPDAERPVLLGVKDVLNDQGGRVKLTWRGSNRDLAPLADVSEYRVWRSVPSNFAFKGVSEATLLDMVSVAPDRWMMSTSAAGTIYWEYLATQPAGRLTGYSYVAPTTSDSIPGSNPRTLFMIEARTVNGSLWWHSNPDSGYSVDNLPPYVVMGLAGTYATGTGIALHWHPNSDADLDEYVVHRGPTPDFIPNSSTLLGVTRDTTMADPNGSFGYYKVAAVDVHSNRGAVATLAMQDIPVGTLLSRFEAEAEGSTIRITVTVSLAAQSMSVRILRATYDDLGEAKELVPSATSIEPGIRSFVDGTVASGETYWYWAELSDDDGVVAVTGPVIASVSAAVVMTSIRGAIPNPLRESTMISYVIGQDVTASGRATVSIRLYDARGRLVRSLIDEDQSVGQHEAQWDGRDQRGERVRAGIYYWRFQASEVLKSGSLVVLQ